MDYLPHVSPIPGARVQVSRFEPGRGAGEVHLSVYPPAGGTFAQQLAAVEAAYEDACLQLALPTCSAVFRRLFVSDGANQREALEGSPLLGEGEDGPVAISIVEQPPLPERKLALWAYHVVDSAGLPKERLAQGLSLTHEGRTHLWTTGLTSAQSEGAADADLQTRQIFEAYGAQLASVGARLSRDTLRTWLYVQNIDVNYAGMVRARRELFASAGLTPETHYIASTGIEGRHENPRRSVLFDAYAVTGLAPAQVRYLSAPHHLGPTDVYGVTFERGVSVTYGDRRHVLISGTASIEPGGRTLHQGDVGRQLTRALENVEALLADAGLVRRDLAHAIVYLRDAGDREAVEAQLESYCPGLPLILVRAPVCRPEWLVEVECLAIRAVQHPEFTQF